MWSCSQLMNVADDSWSCWVNILGFVLFCLASEWADAVAPTVIAWCLQPSYLQIDLSSTLLRRSHTMACWQPVAHADQGTGFKTVWLIIISLQLTGLSQWFSSVPLPKPTDLWLMRFVFRLVVEHKLTNQWEWIHILSCKRALLQWSVFNIQINFKFSGWFC